jgi:hypothetical protein
VELCAKQAPALEELAPGHLVSCHRARELNLAGIGDAHGLGAAADRRAASSS